MDLKKIISNMTLKQKIGQLMQYNANIFGIGGADITGPRGTYGLDEDDVMNVGSVLNHRSAEDVRKIQDMHLSNDPNKIPLIFMMDVIHGYRTIYPIPLALGCSFNPEMVKECSHMASVEATANGTQVTFTPMVDYVRDPRWGRVMESCGEDVLLNCVMAKAQVEGFQGENLKDGENLATCVKHFAAYGGAESGRDYNTVELSEHILRECYLPAYKAAIDAGTTMIMPSFNSLNGVPSIANSWLMRKILKEEWNFDGVVISDYNAIGELYQNHGIAADAKNAARLAFYNNCDIEMCSSAYLHHLEDLVNEGVFTEEQIDSAVLRVLELKEKLGLFENPYHGIDEEKYERIVLSKEHRDIVRKSAEESAVLLKNDGTLPFSTDAKKVAIIGPFADEKSIIGWWHCNGVDNESVTVYEGVKNLLPDAEITVVNGCGCLYDDTDTSGISEAVKAARDADIVILCLGEPQCYSGEGNSRSDITLPGVQMELAKGVIEANQNTAVVLFNGRPLAIPELDKIAPAILDMWFPGTEGGNATANLLFGVANPSGKVAMTFPKSVGQCPIYYNHPNTGRPNWSFEDKKKANGYSSDYIDCATLPLYSFGHGLSYCDFSYGDIELSSDKLTYDGELTVTVKIKNNSNISGKEVVQLYMRDMVASTVRPVQQLIAFDKIEFAPFEEKTVTFTVNEEMLRFYNSEHKLVSENGKFRLSVGYADHLINTTEFELI